jgi:hypothetical protein
MVTKKVFFQGFVIFLKSDEKVIIYHQQLFGRNKTSIEKFRHFPKINCLHVCTLDKHARKQRSLTTNLTCQVIWHVISNCNLLTQACLVETMYKSASILFAKNALLKMLVLHIEYGQPPWVSRWSSPIRSMIVIIPWSAFLQAILVFKIFRVGLPLW